MVLGVGLGWFARFGVVLESFWDGVGIVWESFLNGLGMVWRWCDRFGERFGIVWGSVWDCPGIVSGHLKTYVFVGGGGAPAPHSYRQMPGPIYLTTKHAVHDMRDSLSCINKYIQGGFATDRRAGSNVNGEVSTQRDILEKYCTRAVLGLILTPTKV